MTAAISNDNPTELARVAHSMAGMATGASKKHPWWAVAAAVEGIVQLAAEPGPMQEPATVALQAMAAIYNKRVGEK